MLSFLCNTYLNNAVEFSNKVEVLYFSIRSSDVTMGGATEEFSPGASPGGVKFVKIILSYLLHTVERR